MLLPDGTAPPITPKREVISLNDTLSTGTSCCNHGNQSYTTKQATLGFFTQVQK